MVPPARLRRIKLTALLLLAAIAGGIWLAARPSPPAVAAPPRPAREIPLADVSPWGANFFLHEEVDAWNAEQTVEWAEAAGIRWAKQHFPWYEIERSPGDFRWEKYDRIVDLYRAHGIEVIARLDFPEDWVEAADWVPADKRRPPVNFPPEDFDDYGRFVRATVEHFKGRVRFYQIWNEPNLIDEWGWNPSHPVDPADYVDLLAVAADAAREADPNVVILTAPLAINRETVDLGGNMNELDYLRGMYDAGAAEHFDILSVNAFGIDRPPADPPAEDRLNFRRVELQRQIMAEAEDSCTAVWAAEYGWNAAPPGVPSIWGRVSDEDQANFTVDGVDYAQAQWPWAGVLGTWFFRHPNKSREDPVYYFHMVDEAFNRQRVYAAVQAAAAPAAIAGPGEWAERSSPVVLGSLDDWQWAWDGSPEERAARPLACLSGDCCRAPEAFAADYNYIASTALGASLKFRFDGPSVAVRAKTLSQAATLGAAVDGDGENIVMKEADGWVWYTVAEGLPDGVHTLDLSTGSAGGRVAIDGFRVGSGASPDPRRPWLMLLGGLALGLTGLLLVDMRHVAGRIRV